MYSSVVMEHFTNPRNVGVIEDADGVGTEGNPVCGDIMKIYIKFQTFGCGAAIASTSMLTEMVKGTSLDHAMSVTNANVAEALGGLPPQKLHCSNLAADALHKAIAEYRSKRASAG
jgi:nitrogen fixation NifU-like protein